MGLITPIEISYSFPIDENHTENIWLGQPPRVMIFGVTGQDGSYLSELLLKAGHNVVGVARRTSSNNLDRLEHVLHDDNFSLVSGDVTDFVSICNLIKEHQPDWIFNLAAMSHVGTSFKEPIHSINCTGLGCVNILEAIRIIRPKTRFYQASSSEMFGKVQDKVGQNEDTKFIPQSPYSAAKLLAHNFVRIYREGYGLDARAGILFNHESPRRGEEFVTRKITKWIGQFVTWNGQNEFIYGSNLSYEYNNDHISLCAEKRIHHFPKLRLGNLDIYRDWGHAKDYVRAMYKIMLREKAEDFVIATGETYSVKDFLKEAFKVSNLGDWEQYVVIDESLKRPVDVDFLLGDASKARRVLNWKPEITFHQLVKEMVEYDILRH